VIDEMGRIFGAERVGEAATGRPLAVGTERDLPALRDVDLAVVVDADGVLRVPTYRAAEEGLRLLARVVAAAGRGPGRRAVVQTADPGHEVLEALRRGDPMPFLAAEIERRSAAGFPPVGEVLVVETADAGEGADGELRAAVGEAVEVHGPALRRGRQRWLLQARDLRPARVALRGLVQEWRDGGARVRVDVDPVDL
jgi:primosomal protein N' (replication factor Y)